MYVASKFKFSSGGSNRNPVTELGIGERPDRVPTRPGKPGKMRVHLENLEISWNFEKINKYHGKMT